MRNKEGVICQYLIYLGLETKPLPVFFEEFDKIVRNKEVVVCQSSIHLGLETKPLPVFLGI